MELSFFNKIDNSTQLYMVLNKFFGEGTVKYLRWIFCHLRSWLFVNVNLLLSQARWLYF